VVDLVDKPYGGGLVRVRLRELHMDLPVPPFVWTCIQSWIMYRVMGNPFEWNSSTLECDLKPYLIEEYKLCIAIASNVG
jgi:hypothetical protein